MAEKSLTGKNINTSFYSKILTGPGAISAIRCPLSTVQSIALQAKIGFRPSKPFDKAVVESLRAAAVTRMGMVGPV